MNRLTTEMGNGGHDCSCYMLKGRLGDRHRLIDMHWNMFPYLLGGIGICSCDIRRCLLAR